MTKKELKRYKIFSFLATIPVVSTTQVSHFFEEHGSPNKRASAALREMEKEKVIEGRNREKGLSKIWRLSKKGRELFSITRRPVPLTVRNLDHYLAIGDVYLHLLKQGELNRFECELRNVTDKVKYCPDAFFTSSKGSFYVEVQRSALSRTRWGEKWKVARKYFEHHTAYPIIVLSDQKKEIVAHGFDRLDLILVHHIEEFCL